MFNSFLVKKISYTQFFAWKLCEIHTVYFVNYTKIFFKEFFWANLGIHYEHSGQDEYKTNISQVYTYFGLNQCSILFKHWIKKSKIL